MPRRKTPHTFIKPDPNADEILNCLLKNSTGGIKLEPCSDPDDSSDIKPRSRNADSLTVENGVNECEICFRTFKAGDLYERHLETHKETTYYRCDICGQSFTNAGALERHTKARHNVNEKNRRYLCSICGKAYPSEARLEEHHRIHTQEMPFQCEYCHRRFRNKRNLSDHVRSHEDVRPYACTECDKSFFRSHHLTRHRLMHTNERPYVCPICPKSFRRTQTLNAHLQRHKADHYCGTCKKEFESEALLKKHRENKHKILMKTTQKKGKKDIFCEYCYEEFRSQSGLTRHMNLNHLDELIEAMGPSEEETNSNSTEQSENVHNSPKADEVKIFACKYCWRLFENREKLLSHFECCGKKKS